MKKIVSLSLFTLLAFNLFAQNPHFTIGANVTVANPQGEFEKVTGNKNMWGGSIEGFAGLGWGNIGLNMNYLYRGGDTFKRSLGGPQGVPVNADVDITNGLLNLQLVGRLMYPEGMFRPYVEGFVGGAFFSTTTSAKDRNSGEEIAGDTNQDDFTWVMGYSAGALFKIWEDRENSMQLMRPSTLFIDFKLKNNFGGQAEYLLSSNDIYFDDASSTWKTRTSTSKTDYLSWHVGVAVVF
ncbi:MAG: outer membrane beta-barrel protein [Bacteroidetes bacterium]|nr:outer membrane beta-barrel protein [Bacteroidota bacterium]